MNGRIVAVVVTYNRKELLAECISHLLEQTYCAFDIFIVDNHSTDGTADYIGNYLNDDRVKYYDTGANLGGAGGFQYGLKKAVEEGYEYIWLMDDDSMPSETALEKLVEADEQLDSHEGFLSSKVIWTDGEICNMNIQRTSATKRVEDFSTPTVPIVVASFVSLFVPTSVIRDVGLPFKEFFIWTDDWEYTKRIANKYPSYLINDSVVVHKTASNTGSNIALDSEDRLKRYEYAYRNEMYFYKREGFKGLCYYLMKIILHSYRVIIHAPNMKRERLKIIYTNAYKGISFDPEVEFPEL